MENITLYDLMAEDFDVWVTKNRSFGLNLQIDDENGKTIVNEQLHPAAADSFADFCRRYLASYNRATEVEAA